MDNQVETQYARFRRIVVEPYWCKGSPLDWWHTEAGIGITRLADTSVGHFNLAWWLLDRSEPPLDAKVYSNTNIRWVILHAYKVRFGRFTLTEWASFMTLAEWKKFVLAQQAKSFRFEGQGMTYSDLKKLL